MTAYTGSAPEAAKAFQSELLSDVFVAAWPWENLHLLRSAHCSPELHMQGVVQPHRTP